MQLPQMTYVSESEDTRLLRRIRDSVVIVCIRRVETGKIVLENDIGAASKRVEYPLRRPFGDIGIIPERE